MTTRQRHAAYNKLLFRLDSIRCSLRDRQHDSDEDVTEELELAAEALLSLAEQTQDLAFKLDVTAEEEAQEGERHAVAAQ
ncbi:MAG TPA: hypothetical protein VM686_00420 [Polyangiaceae bacterium]|nr:hypothetical protein [Polyangiaceae bacterium]